ncbi:hypothetical protein K474DRAFT_1714169 [Panus rudis PR-1116 ss-1]|nr:hypothetical protein K474DRAFT_1714169 [Panus rudis PR-1116 ss-1]
MSISMEDLHATGSGMQLQRRINLDNNATVNHQAEVRAQKGLETMNRNVDRGFEALMVYLKDMENRIGQRFSAVEGRLSVMEGRISGLEGRVGAVEGSIRGVDGSVRDVDGSVRGVERALGERISAVEGTIAALRTDSNVRVSLVHAEVSHIRTVVDRPQQQPEMMAAPPYQQAQPQFQGVMAPPPPPPPPAPPVGPYPGPGAMPYGYQGY